MRYTMAMQEHLRDNRHVDIKEENGMELKTLSCPNCGANLEIEDGIDTFFCKYCGYKIILE